MVEDPKYVPPGRYTLTQIIECVADHYKDKEMYTAQVLADRIKIDKKLMGIVYSAFSIDIIVTILFFFLIEVQFVIELHLLFCKLNK